MYRTYHFALTTFGDQTLVRGRMTVGECKDDGSPDVNTAKLWTPADLDVAIHGCSHGLTLPVAEFVAGAAHIVCCSARQAWEELTLASAPCTTVAKVYRHPVINAENRT